MVIEEGVEIDTLHRIAASMRQAADAAEVAIVTGDTKVVGRAVAEHPAMVVMQALFGGGCIVDMLLGEQLPRICRAIRRAA